MCTKIVCLSGEPDDNFLSSVNLLRCSFTLVASIMNSKLKELNVEFLFQAILKLETIEECYKFFEDLCTVPELRALSQRFLVAKMLDDHIVYSDIVAKTGASTATISRVNRSLNYGNDGYRIVFERLEKDHEL